MDRSKNKPIKSSVAPFFLSSLLSSTRPAQALHFMMTFEFRIHCNLYKNIGRPTDNNIKHKDMFSVSWPILNLKAKLLF